MDNVEEKILIIEGAKVVHKREKEKVAVYL